jgi:hypothetical protein
MKNKKQPHIYFKILTATGKASHGGCHTFSLPTKDKPGAWASVEGKIVECENGFHVTADPERWSSNSSYNLTTPGHLRNGSRKTFRLFLCEVAGDRSHNEPLAHGGVSKVAARHIRLLKEVGFAICPAPGAIQDTPQVHHLHASYRRMLSEARRKYPRGRVR